MEPEINIGNHLFGADVEVKHSFNKINYHVIFTLDRHLTDIERALLRGEVSSLVKDGFLTPTEKMMKTFGFKIRRIS